MQSTVTIMVVDDDERGRRLTSRMLRDEGYTVIEAVLASRPSSVWRKRAKSRSFSPTSRCRAA